MNWYVLQVTTGREAEIVKELRRLGFKATAPSKIMTERHQGEWLALLRIVFPSYVFVKTNLTDHDYYKITGIPRIYRFLGVGGPEPLHEDEEDFIIWLDNDGLPLAESDIQISEGGEAKVLYGPLKGYEGKIVKIIKRQRRAIIAITIGGQRKEFSLSINLLQPPDGDN